MQQHLIAYRGTIASLAVMQEMYLDTFVPWANDSEATAGVRMIAPIGFPEEREWVQGLAKNIKHNVIFAVLAHRDGADLGSHEYLGHTGIHKISWPDGIGTTGSILINKAEWEKGFGTEAKLLLQYHAFRVLGLRKLTSEVKAFNARSLGHLIKCGYRIVGRYKDHTFHDGKFVDQIMLEVSHADWEPIWKKYKEKGTLPHLTKRQRRLVGSETGT